MMQIRLSIFVLGLCIFAAGVLATVFSSITMIFVGLGIMVATAALDALISRLKLRKGKEKDNHKIENESIK